MAQQILPPSESWSRIDAWLATHAASDFALLNPPATRDDIEQAERLLGIPVLVILLSLSSAMTG
ncbi:hypothetical protein ABZ782_35630 [Streptomyces asoensis]|uniref:hypothetical protein n=1 Tax=Streptomyces asoensis TaxID=249586 RepID=UPI0034042384